MTFSLLMHVGGNALSATSGWNNTINYARYSDAFNDSKYPEDAKWMGKCTCGSQRSIVISISW